MTPEQIGKLRVVMGVVDFTDPNRVERKVLKVTRHKHFDGRKLVIKYLRLLPTVLDI